MAALAAFSAIGRAAIATSHRRWASSAAGTAALAARAACTFPATAPASALRAAYERDGFVIVKSVIDPGLVAELRRHVDFLAARWASTPGEHWHHLIMRNDAFWVRVVSDERLVSLAANIAPFLQGAPGVALFSSHYFVKQPRTGMKVLWHQDGSYWPLRPMDVATAWLAVDESDRDNGCLRVVRGTHRQDLAELVPDRTVKNVLGSATHSDADIDPADIIDLELQPGDVSFHHPNIVHGSEPNTSDRRRCGLTIRYISTATQCTDPEQPVMLLRGVGDATVSNAYRSWPKYRADYDMPFAGCETWNGRRYVNPSDEAYFARTDYAAMDSEIRAALDAFIDKLGGR